MVAITIIAAAVAVAVAVAIKAIAINTIAVAATIAVWLNHSSCASKKAVVLDVLLLAINGNSNSCGNHPMIVVIS